MTTGDAGVPSAAGQGWPWEQPPRSSVTKHELAQWPRITVVTPSFNQGGFLEAAMRSVLLQDYPNLEYIVMDGGSTDDSPNIIRKYESHLAHWQSEKDSGQAAAIGAGFAMATGEIFCWLNSDDILLPGALRHVAQIFAKHPGVGFVYGNRRVIDADGRVTGEHIWPHYLTRYHWAVGQSLAQECSFWRRSVYEQVGGIDRAKFFIMDYDLFYRMWTVTRFRKTAAFLGCIRMHADTKNNLHQDIWKRELQAAVRQYKLVAPGPLRRRLISRFDGLQMRLELFFARPSRADGQEGT